MGDQKVPVPTFMRDWWFSGFVSIPVKGTLEWGKNISPENMTALREGALFVLLKADGNPHAFILIDTFGTIREKLIDAPPERES